MGSVTIIAAIERGFLAAFGAFVVMWSLKECVALSIDGIGENRVVFLGNGSGGGVRGVSIIAIGIGSSGVKETNVTGANDLVLRDAASSDALDRD